MKLNSKSYFHNQFIPFKFCRHTLAAGQNKSPNFSWVDFPPNTKSFVLTFIDRYPKAKDKIHWLLTDIPRSVTNIPEGASNSSSMPNGVKELPNAYGQSGYDGPEPPKGDPKHNYEAIVYALKSDKSGISGPIDEKKLMKKIKSDVVAQANLLGYFNY